MHSRNFYTHNNNDNANHNNNKMVNTVNNNSNNNNACLNPLAYNADTHSGMTHNDATGLRAASHVSMEHTIAAHEYQPTCNCADCQTLLKHYTQYDILDAYATHHLAYESSLRANFGFVPAIGGPFGHVAMKTVTTDIVDEQTGEVVGKEEQQQPVPSNSYLFHMHLHHMNPVPADVKERSHTRFYAPKDTTTNNNNNSVSIPTPHSKRNNNNNNKVNNYHHRNNNNNGNHHYNNNNYYNNNNGAPSAAVPSYYNQQQQQVTPHYTAADVEQATNASNFTGGAARLGN